MSALLNSMTSAAMLSLVIGAVGGCRETPPAPTSATSTAPPAVLADAPRLVPRVARKPLDGRAFPEGALALTWDDGPDEGTLELARYLHAHRISATFFVVGAWIPGLSAEPGEGRRVLETGHEALPLLGDLTALGHRLGNHTLNHVLLSDASAETVRNQLGDNQLVIDPYLSGGLPVFRAPGGAWSASASAAIDDDPWLARLVGPVHWDIDGKDWEGSLYCRSVRPSIECERAAPGGGARVKAKVTARRYLSIVASVGHGIVLLHDRVGHVGSDYALEVARDLVPELEARGYVFVAPVLHFSPLAPQAAAASRRPPPPASARSAAIFGDAVDPTTVQSGDVDGDGRADLCARDGEGVLCALSQGAGFAHARRWSVGTDFGDVRPEVSEPIRLGDINGDGRADVCERRSEGLVCALSNGHALLRATLWLAEMSDAAGFRGAGATLQLEDINGDGRADVCGQGPSGAVCALAP